MREYHEGETAVQERAGVRDAAEGLRGMFKRQIPRGAARFLYDRRFIVLGFVDGEGRVWSGWLTGPRGFLIPRDDRTLLIASAPLMGDPLHEALTNETALGTLVINPALRQRMRFNGVGRLTEDGVELRVHECFGNCPKFIQKRHVHEREASTERAGRFVAANELSASQQEWIAAADTFYIASVHAGNGADASHRGGMPGFTRVEADGTILFPDYDGNNMFLTLGNIQRDPRVGLLFGDFQGGGALRVSGRARLLWDDPRQASFPGARRLIEVTPERVIESTGEVGLAWELEEYSPFNPR